MSIQNGKLVCEKNATHITETWDHIITRDDFNRSSCHKEWSKEVHLNFKGSRGRSRQEWFNAFHEYLINEFDRMRKLNVKFNNSILRALALKLLETSESPSSYSYNIIDFHCKNPLHTLTCMYLEYNSLGSVIHSLIQNCKLSLHRQTFSQRHENTGDRMESCSTPWSTEETSNLWSG